MVVILTKLVLNQISIEKILLSLEKRDKNNLKLQEHETNEDEQNEMKH